MEDAMLSLPLGISMRLGLTPGQDRKPGPSRNAQTVPAPHVPHPLRASTPGLAVTGGT
jgi:hypothetical protein